MKIPKKEGLYRVSSAESNYDEEEVIVAYGKGNVLKVVGEDLKSQSVENYNETHSDVSWEFIS